MLIEIWSDVACPWCYIGKRRLESALAAFPHAEQLGVVYRSFELDPTAPQEGSESVVEALVRKYGPRAPAMVDRVPRWHRRPGPCAFRAAHRVGGAVREVTLSRVPGSDERAIAVAHCSEDSVLHRAVSPFSLEKA